MTYDPTRDDHLADGDPNVELIMKLGRLRDRQAQAAAAASPLTRAIINEHSAGTYDRLAPLIADLDPTWKPGAHRGGRHAATSQPAPPVFGATPTVNGNFTSATPSAEGANRNKIVMVLVKAASAVRHPRRRRRD